MVRRMAPAMIRLDPMTNDQFDHFRVESMKQYAQEKKRGEGLSDVEANALAQTSFAELLPQGLDTPQQHLWTLVEPSSGKAIGALWIQVREKQSRKEAYIYDFVIHPSFRGQGYGRASLNAMETWLIDHGVTRIGLHVFGHNHTARQLYGSMGYEATNLVMAKVLPFRSRT